MTVAIFVSDETHQLIKQARLPGRDWNETGVQQPDGRWRIPVDDEVFNRLNRGADRWGLTFDQLIQQLIRGVQ